MLYILLICASCFKNEKELRLWYDLPSSKIPINDDGNSKNYGNNDYLIWEQNSLPLGNGRLGANIFGEINKEKIIMAEQTLWNGGPSPKRPNYNGGNIPEYGRNGELVKEIQKLFEEGKDQEAYDRCGKLIGSDDGYGSYQYLGDLFFEFGHQEDQVTDYVRYLDLDTAIHTVQYKYKGTKFTRETFISNPDSVMAIHFGKEGSQKVSFNMSFHTEHPSVQTVQAVYLNIAGSLEDNGMLFDTQFLILLNGGKISSTQTEIVVEDADDTYIFGAVLTDYKHEYPKYRTGDTAKTLLSKVDDLIENAFVSKYDGLKEAHIRDHQNLFNRTSLDIGQKPANKPINALLDDYKNNASSPDQERMLEVLFFQYGRYLTITSSRENSPLPSNLQGIWNNENDPIWSSDFHANINLQENYWTAPVTDLGECELPLVDYLEKLRIPGRITTTVYTGINATEEIPEQGFMIHVTNNPFGRTAPGSDFMWGWSPSSVTWTLMNVFDLYEFTGDEKLMDERIYPMLRENAIMFTRFVKEENKTSKDLIVTPALSPEQPPRTNGNTYEQIFLWKLLTITIERARKNKVDQEWIPKWKHVLDNLKTPLQIGEDGQILEWYTETKLGSMGIPGHRHMSHLLSLYPMNLISYDTPDLLAAATVSLIDRGDIATGWGMGERVCSWARTGDGVHTYGVLRKMIQKRIFSNLWDYHNRFYTVNCTIEHNAFQIDGNFAGAAGVAEMLIQSHMEYVRLLPAISPEWKDGNFKGLIGRGNFQFNVTWKDGKIKIVSVKSRKGNDCKLFVEDTRAVQVINAKGENIVVHKLDENRLMFPTKVGEIYIVKFADKLLRSKASEKVQHKRLTHNQVQMNWNHIPNAIGYNVYRQIGDLKPILIARNITETSYVDTNNYECQQIPSSTYYVNPVYKFEINDSNLVGKKQAILIVSVSLFAVICMIITIIVVRKQKSVNDTSFVTEYESLTPVKVN